MWRDATGHGAIGPDATRRDTIQRCATRRDAIRRDRTRCDATRCDIIRRCATRFDVMRRDAIRRDRTLRDRKRRNATHFNTIRRDVTRCDAMQYNSTLCDAAWRDAVHQMGRDTTQGVDVQWWCDTSVIIDQLKANSRVGCFRWLSRYICSIFMMSGRLRGCGLLSDSLHFGRKRLVDPVWAVYNKKLPNLTIYI